MEQVVTTVEWWTVLPFALLLFAIATFPLLRWTKHLWEHNWFKLIVALSFGVPMGLYLASGVNPEGVVVALAEYFQFITLLLALFVISGGVFVAGDIKASPRNNVIFLAIGGILASFIGTTGAAVLLIRPILNTNSERQHKVHTVVFAILIIANCGGLLTPLGDPPLFLGMLRGVPFLWTFNLLFQWLFVNGFLLLNYYYLDRKFYNRERPEAIRWDDTRLEPISIIGSLNLALLIVLILTVAFVPSIDLHKILAGHATTHDWIPWREIDMLVLILLSLKLGDARARVMNEFEWAPIEEVAALFIGIFLTMAPALMYLRQIAPTLPLNEITLYIFSGGLSAVLDNAPTYATFFEMARALGGNPSVAGVREIYLISISLGAVTGGAITYIGNGPNFMVKSIAESRGVSMPTFAGYTVRWAFQYLIPGLFYMVLIFIVPNGIINLLGILSVVIHSFLVLKSLQRYPDPHNQASSLPS